MPLDAATTGETIMTVHLTQAHIDVGERRQCTRCPLARAIADALIALGPGYRNTRVSVTSEPNGPGLVIHARFGPPMAPWFAMPPRRVSQAIRKYDDGHPLTPTAFQLAQPPSMPV